jgi:parallel beta-helix repeat protein
MKIHAEAARRSGRGYRSARAASGAIEALERRLLLATLTVNTNSDANSDSFNGSSDGSELSLREAILLAGGNMTRPLTGPEKNQVSGAVFVPAPGFDHWTVVSGVGSSSADHIVFSDSATTISPSGQLPDLGKNDTIDGARPGGGKVTLAGQSAGQVTGIVMRGFNGPSANEVKNLEIRDFFYDGIYGEGIQYGSFSGLLIHNNGQEGILLTTLTTGGQTFNPRGNRIGGSNTPERNYIYNNGRHGISIFASTSADRQLLGNTIQNNWIGLNTSGNTDQGNGANGILLSNAHGNLITSNVVSGNNNDGIQISGAKAHSNTLTGNLIGTDTTGVVPVGNTFSGVALIDAGAFSDEFGQPNVIGQPGNGNTIAGNGGAGVYMAGANATGNVVQSNSIGLAPGLGNAGAGVGMYGGANNNTIGGPDSTCRNVIQFSGGPGVDIANGGSNNNLVKNNYIGTDNGARSRPNGGGVRIYGGAASNTIAVNVISGNSSQGVGIYNPGSSANLVQDNFIGTNAQGTAALANGESGVVIQEGASGNSVAGNVISGNSQNGVLLQHGNTTGNTISGNKIGTKADGTSSLPNQNVGVRINGAVGSTIGLGNVIRFNALDGIFVESGTGNAIRGNSIAFNGGLGIDLGPDGVTANDSLDADSGANSLQNFPILTAATLAPPAATIVGGLHSKPSTTFKIDLFYNNAGGDEGENYFATFDVTTDVNGNASFGHSYAAAFPNGITITATATDPAGNTSEFSAPIKTFTTQAPFSGTPFSIPGLIQAEDFDQGGEGLAYHDLSFTNDGGAYRPTAVDIEPTSDTLAGFDVGYVYAGEWLEYTVNVAGAGKYDLHLRLANTTTGGRLHIEFDGGDVTGSVNVPSTGNFQAFSTVVMPVTLAPGQHVMRVMFDAASTNGYVGNINWLRFNRAPQTGLFTVNPSPAVQGQILILTLDSATDLDGTVQSVSFYRESNGLVGLQTGAGGDTILGTDTSAVSGWSIGTLTTGLPPGNYNYYAFATDDLGATSLPVGAAHVINPVPPKVASADWAYNALRQNIQYVFTQDVGGSLGTPDFSLQNLTTGAEVPTANIALTYNPATLKATFTFPGYPSGILPDGNYRARLLGAGITNSGGVALDGDNDNTAGGNHIFDFFHLSGDANHDRHVDFNDLVVLAQNYNQAQKTFSQGDFNYDSGTDFNDLVMLAQRYNTSLPAAAAVPELAIAASSASPASVWDPALPAMRRPTPVDVFSTKRFRPRHR